MSINDTLSKIKPGDYVRLRTTSGLTLEGLVLPRYSSIEKKILVLKLSNGYNVGIRAANIANIEILSRSEVVSKLEEAGAPAELIGEEERKPPQKKIMILGTGGTIASKIDYETGAVKPALTAEDLVDAIPELLEHGVIYAESVLNIFSENMTPRHWSIIAENVYKIILKGYDGVVIAHGTDTMGYTAAALAFALRRLPYPVAIVGSQRSSDRPSSDAAFNLLSAVTTTLRAPFGEVVVVMHGSISDTYALAHRGVRVRKMHTSRRDAFQSINDVPLAKIYPHEKKIELLRDDYIARSSKEETELLNGFDERVFLLKIFPGITGEIIDFLVDKGVHGIVLEGTGLGHTPESMIKHIERAVEENVAIVMTSQCLFGTINMNVYSTGRKLLEAGVIPGEDMLPETAYVKLSWVLGRERDLKEVARIMRTNLVGEIGTRRNIAVYPRWYYG